MGLILWGGGLLALWALLRARGAPLEDAPWSDAPPPSLARRIHRFACGPGAFLTLLTGIGLLHHQPELLKQPWIHAKLALILGLFALDHLGDRAIRQGRAPGRTPLTLTGLTLLGVVLLGALRPWAR